MYYCPEENSGVIALSNGESDFLESIVHELFEFATEYTTSIAERTDKTPTPNTFSLFQNYPNPFNPTTTIEYVIKNDAYVNLVVYDLLGREVRTLVNERQQPGEYDVKFHSDDLPSGLYLYKITAGDFTSIRKMMLIK